jgi:peptidyl-prolyl cis-trans isomerase B (cyclophilin B)
MTQQVQRPPAGERGPEPDALQKIAQDFRNNKGPYMAAGILLLVVLAAILVIANLGGGDDSDDFSPVWNAYSGASERILQNRPAADELADLDRAVEQARGTKAEGAALWLSAIAHYGAAFTKDKLSYEDRKPDLERARERLADLEDKRFDYFPPAVSRWFTASGEPPVKRLLGQVEADLSWSKEHTYVEPEADAAPTAVLRTDAGDIHLRFYAALAPRHVENFVELAKAGAYNGTAFHFVNGSDPKLGIAGGDPFSYFYNDPLQKDHILRWGHGGTGYNLPPEESRFRMVHRRGTVTTQRREGADWDNGAQFRIVLDTDPSLDRAYTPFASVVEGMSVVDRAAARPTAADHAVFKDDPAFQSLGTQGLVVEPVWIQKVIVYDESGNAMQHAFPLEEGERSLSSLAATPLKPLKGADLRANRSLVDPREAEQARPGIDIPFPSDIADPAKADPEGERRVPEKATADGQEPEEKPAEDPTKTDSEKKDAEEKEEPAEGSGDE